ncbi:putative RDD family membrane protein YckC [Sediminihabitans luteus]|uniref:Putative RDD family membrane protein YckC n=1 Tax=Sediminihabitans luteus TaxID=1138585 RepID=A0A2M9CDQ5_9CELL|nr:RDD family protein [Sediminihabitans luteus]PJJ70009.1 putative RDD family membrane protein YckC [Sediminihabitans luteus]GII99330.1 membrane protein [Sediminihabitans luteus]
MQHGIVTGEGVLLDARPASFATRAVAGVIDALTVVAVVLLPLAIALAAYAPESAWEGFGPAISILTIVLVTVAVPTTVETLWRGRSLGKLALGIRVVRDDGGPVRFRQAFVRALVGVGELWLTAGSVAIVASLLHPRGKRIGDVLAGTYALRVRTGRTTDAPLVMPPWLVTWAQGADMRRLPDGLALAARQFVGRAPRLAPASRVRLAADLAGQVERYVAPGPPPGTPPEVFLAAVLAERRLREHAVALMHQEQASRQSASVRRLPHAVPDPAR